MSTVVRYTAGLCESRWLERSTRQRSFRPARFQSPLISGRLTLKVRLDNISLLFKNYTQVVDDVSELELSMTETQALVALYSAGGNAHLEMILTGEDAQDELLQTLEGQNLVIREGDDLQLTSCGEVVVTEKIEAVNQ